MNTAYIVKNSVAADALQRDLPEGSRAFGVGSSKGGARFDRIVWLTEQKRGSELEIMRQASWWSDFQCCLPPDGKIVT